MSSRRLSSADAQGKMTARRLSHADAVRSRELVPSFSEITSMLPASYSEVSPLLGNSYKQSLPPPESARSHGPRYDTFDDEDQPESDADSFKNDEDADVGSQNTTVRNETSDEEECLLGTKHHDEGRSTKGSMRPEVNLAWLLPSMAIGIILSAADSTLVVSSFGRIGSDLNALNNISWIANAYYLTLTSFQPLYGKLSDIFGRKTTLLFAYTVFGTGCLFCGLARTLPELVAARAFSGMGAGGMTTVVSILISDYVDLKDRGMWQGYINIIWCIGGSAGAPLGGILSDGIGWRWLFIVQAPLCAIAFLSVYTLLPPDQASAYSLRQKARRIDFLGAMTLVSAVFCLLLGIDRGSNVAWADRTTITCCVLAIPLFLLFIYVEVAVAAHPFAPGHVVFGRALLPGFLVNFFVFSCYIGNQFFIPLYLQAVHGFTPSQVGYAMISPILLSVTASVTCGRIMQKTGRYYWLNFVLCAGAIPGALMTFLFSGLVAKVPLIVAIGLSINGMAMGGSSTTTLISTLANAEPEDQAVATATTYLFRALGSIVGISMNSTMIQMLLRTLLRRGLDSGDEAERIILKVRESLDYIRMLEPATRDVVVQCYQRATNAAFGLTLIAAFIALACACFIRETSIIKR